MQPLTYEPGDYHSLDVDHITVDGKRVDYVVMACPRRGVVEAYRDHPGRRGRIKMHKRGKHPITERRRGAVRVVFRDGTVDAGGGRGNP